MSECTDIKIGKLSVYTFCNFFDLTMAAVLFSDNCMSKKENYVDQNWPESHTQYLFSTSVAEAQERMDFLGFTIDKARRDFIGLFANSTPYEIFDSYSPWVKNISLSNCAAIEFDNWRKALKKYCSFLTKNNSKYLPSPKTAFERSIHDYLDDAMNTSFWGINSEKYDARNVIRIILNLCKKDEVVSCDASNIYRDEKIEGYYKKASICVEGETDRAIINFGIEQLFPHLKDLVNVISKRLGELKNSGGIDSALRELVTLINNNPSNRVLLVLDNDFDGKKARQKIDKKLALLNYPAKVINYPNIKFAEHYPPFSKYGENINGVGCSIELYLPPFILKDSKSKRFCPIVHSSGTLQCHISGKDGVFKRFRSYSTKVRKKKRNFNSREWRNLLLLVSEIINSIKIMKF